MLAFLLCAVLGGGVVAVAFVLSGGTYLQGLVVYLVSCSVIALIIGAIRAVIAARRSKNGK